jgi:4a-hydroxytetrahydrobiopterin dehydratase
MAKMTSDQLQNALRNLPDWDGDVSSISKTWEFEDFVEAMGFVIELAQLAEDVGHHPDIDIRYNKVTLTLSTHEEDGVTERDVRLARELDELR